MMTASGGKVAARARSGSETMRHGAMRPRTVAMTHDARVATAERGGRVTLSTLGGFSHLGAAVDDVTLLNCNTDENQHHAEEVGACGCLVEEQETEHGCCHRKQ